MCCLLEEEQVFLHFAVALVQVGFIEQALEIALVASAYVRVRLPKAHGGGLV